jgi:hypothetical protein
VIAGWCWRGGYLLHVTHSEHLDPLRSENQAENGYRGLWVQVKVLKKDQKGKEVLDTDTFTFDKKFTHSLYKIKINQIQIKETVEENKRTNDQVTPPMPARFVCFSLALLNMWRAVLHGEKPF